MSKGNDLIERARNAVDIALGRVWRCEVTGNPVGTDTRMIGGQLCGCQGCHAASALEASETTIASLSKALAEAEKKGAEDTGRMASYYASISRCLERYHAMAVTAERRDLWEFIEEAQVSVAERAPLHKLNRWVGYIQGVLIEIGCTGVLEERDWTRPLFRPLDFPPPRDLSQGGQP